MGRSQTLVFCQNNNRESRFFEGLHRETNPITNITIPCLMLFNEFKVKDSES